MNDKNTEFFFGDEENVVLTLQDEDGRDMEAQIMAAFEIEELGTEYLMAVVLSGDEDEEELSGEIHALKYQEDENGEPEILIIEDEEEMEIVSQAMQEILKNGDFGELEFVGDEDEEETTDDNYLDDIGSIFPGVSIDREEDEL